MLLYFILIVHINVIFLTQRTQNCSRNSTIAFISSYKTTIPPDNVLIGKTDKAVTVRWKQLDNCWDSFPIINNCLCGWPGVEYPTATRFSTNEHQVADSSRRVTPTPLSLFSQLLLPVMKG